nr:Uncharacterised protein [Salmonella sp. NCTC 7297]
MSFEKHDSPLYFRSAREAMRLEQAGEYDRAAKSMGQSKPGIP